MGEDPTKVKLGPREYKIVPQGIGRIRRKFGAVMGMLSEAGGDLEVSELGGEAYEVCKVFIPDLAPEWELLGYAASDRSEPEPGEEVETPTIPQISDAFDAIYRVNGGERLVRLLGNVIGLDLIRAKIRQGIAAWSPSSTSSARSQSESAGAPSTSSTRSDPISNGSGDSPSPGSSLSSTPEPADVVES